MPSLNELQIDRWTPEQSCVADDIRMLGRLLHACVSAGASVGFVQPFSCLDAEAFWNCKVLPAVQSGACRVLVARIGGEIVGTAQLDLATPPNQPHRAEVRKVLVHPDARRRGIARLLMLALEKEAHQAHRNLLTLDTVTGGAAEPLYLSLGYVKVGIIPGYALRPDTPELDATTIMYKQLPVAHALGRAVFPLE
jgi:GNAT superfamily N-acetyltransferase